MITTELYNGQGLGNQLWCYVTVRCIALARGYEFGIGAPEKFKAKEFMNLDFGNTVVGGSGPEGGPPTLLPTDIMHYYREQELRHPHTGADIRLYDPNLFSIEDHTKIDGVMQGEAYIGPYKESIREWLSIHPSDKYLHFSSDDICIINFRGGEYARNADLLLPRKYWEDAVTHMRDENPGMRFVVITDDEKTAQYFFPDFEVHHFGIAEDYTIIHRAKYLIVSNSSFAWFAAWLSTDLIRCIAPKYWARHAISDGYWSLGTSITTGWEYLDREGKLFDYKTCVEEFGVYQSLHPELYSASNTIPPHQTHQSIFRQAIKFLLPNSVIRYLKKRLS
ncbi:MAG: glycosyl transferase [Minisyncoccia bacterium]